MAFWHVSPVAFADGSRRILRWSAGGFGAQCRRDMKTAVGASRRCPCMQLQMTSRDVGTALVFRHFRRPPPLAPCRPWAARLRAAVFWARDMPCPPLARGT